MVFFGRYQQVYNIPVVLEILNNFSLRYILPGTHVHKILFHNHVACLLLEATYCLIS